ncbi:hypothetical protein [Bradyrhizobium liaoningense]|uniref:hypothetical protein n=1 Tax=Bradyrhizobium liaoningense TaxID=43992 RepID=UPI001BA8F0EC|nr:hypothetical protein [Bradyrhizobium liaoningense]MBR0712722.1 hypothetical protein [Bradyrhizobium liaoningense]
MKLPALSLVVALLLPTVAEARDDFHYPPPPRPKPTIENLAGWIALRIKLCDEAIPDDNDILAEGIIYNLIILGTERTKSLVRDALQNTGDHAKDCENARKVYNEIPPHWRRR